MIRFERQPGGYRMRDGFREIVAVHQVLRTPASRPVAAVLRELGPGSIFVAEQAPADNAYLRPYDALDRFSLFPYQDTLGGEFSGDRLTLIVREILDGSSRVDPIEEVTPVPYCVRSGVIDEVHVETMPRMRARYSSLFDRVVFHDRAHRPDTSGKIRENRERL